MGGVILGKRDFIRGPIETYMKHTGGSMSPFNAWIMLKGLETIDLRVRAQTDSAEKIAQRSKDHGKIAKLSYPGLVSHPQHNLVMRQMGKGGTIVTFEIEGGEQAAFRFMNALEIMLISNNLGDAKSIATHPATTTHQRLPQDQKICWAFHLV